MSALDHLDPTVRALCLGARTRPSERATAELRAVGSEIDWARLAALGHLHDVLPLLARSIPHAFGEPGAGGPPAGWSEAVVRRRHATARRNGELAAQLGRVLEAFDRAAIDVVPVKGLVVADWAYDDLASRPAADLDVLVRTDGLEAARSILRDLGYRQAATPTFTTIVHEFHDPPWYLGDGPGQITLELHRSLWSERFTRIPIDQLWERTSVRPFLTGSARLLAPEDMLLHLAIHRSRSPLRLRWVVDVAEAVGRHGDEIDWPALVERARDGGAATALWVVLDLAGRLLDAPIPDSALRALRPTRLHRALLDRTCGATALFRPSANLDQQPHLTLRVLEQDSGRAIAGALATSVRRSAQRVLHERGIRPVRGSEAAPPD
jgi:hypothetical protein